MADLPALFADLVRLEIELWDAVEARLRAELGVGLGTAQTLAVVAAVQDCRVHDIVRGLSITVGGASKTVDRLERSGLVARRPHPSDRRSSVITLTRAGATTHAKAQRLIAAELDARCRCEVTSSSRTAWTANPAGSSAFVARGAESPAVLAHRCSEPSAPTGRPARPRSCDGR